MSADQLDVFLSKFYAALRKEDGTLYTKKSMQGIRYGVQRHFQDLRGWDIVKDNEFTESNKSFKAMLVKLKQEGLGYVKHKPTTPKPDFEKIQASMDTSSPKGLQNKVFVDIMLFLCNRGQENLRSMKESDFIIETGDDGLRAITRRDELTKNNRENADEITGGMMCEIPGNERCPVKSFLAYVSKLNPNCPAFWQKPKDQAPDSEDEPWYCNMPVGVNTLGKKVKVISQDAGCSKVYTNHCLRATCVTVLDDIMSVSGHHSEQSIKHYSRTSEDTKRKMSAAIARKVISPANPSHESSHAKHAKLGPEARPTRTEAIEQQPQPASTGAGTSSSIATARPKPAVGMDIVPVPNNEQTMGDGDLGDLAVLTDSQENRILQDIDIMNNAYSMNSSLNTSNRQTLTLNFHGCSVNFTISSSLIDGFLYICWKLVLDNLLWILVFIDV
ncbi:uncharacterized protein [Amphiura filiformis]|uniref:uncharacterized protein n=1 Tax=Amphiura filiformis TaxID=82378 RepID=UPI003B2174E3